MKRLMLILALLPTLAWGTVGDFETPQQEARYWALAEQLRCLVCQGQSIADSNADLAVDLKREVRRMVLEGKSDAEIADFMVARYGDFVLFKPPVKASTYLLWFGPFLLLIVGLAIWMALGRQRARAPAGELSAAERAQLARALQQRSQENS
jgi:cytochrome c-type biogenesis protein CcmH